MSRLTRRATLAAPTLLLAAGPLRAQDAWPGRAVTLIVPWAPGGSNDVVARMVAPQLEARFGQPFVVENRPGGGGSLGMGMVARARPDGLTLLVSSASNHVFHPLISPDLGYRVPEALAGVAMMVDVPNVVAANNALGVDGIAALVERIRATPGGLAFASSGVGSSNHFAGELFRLRAGLEMTHVPYRGGGQMTLDIMSGTVQTGFTSPQSATPHLKSGRMRILGISSAERAIQLPEVPTIAESGVPGFESTSWFGILGPANLPLPIAQKIHDAIEAAMQDPATRARAIELGCDGKVEGPAAFAAIIRGDDAKWQKAKSEGLLPNQVSR